MIADVDQLREVVAGESMHDFLRFEEAARLALHGQPVVHASAGRLALPGAGGLIHAQRVRLAAPGRVGVRAGRGVPKCLASTGARCRPP